MLPLLLAVMAALTVGLLFGVPVGGALVLLDVAAIGALAGAILQAAVHLVGRRPVRRWTLGLVTVAAGTAGAHLSLAPAAPAVILIVVDCLRADRLTPALMPKTDALAQSSMRFTQARSQSSWTRSSMPSLLSGRFPTEHGLYRTHPRPDRIRDQVPMLAELFSDGGWLTGGFVEQAQLDAAFGYDRGFGRYGFHDGNAAQLDSKFIAWNTLFRTVPRFALLHYIDIHGPYEPRHRPAHLPPSKLATAPSARWRATISGIRDGKIRPTAQDYAHLAGLYDEDVRELDHDLGKLFATLQRDGTLDASWIVFTGDHGERFGEHGNVEHMGDPDEAVLAVPLLIRPPGGVPGRSIADVVQLVDVAPTLLLATGLAPHPDMPGRDLVALDRTQAMPTFAEEWSARRHRVSVRDGDWKLVRSSGTTLYDLSQDPAEAHDVSAAHPDLVVHLDSLLAAYFNAEEQGLTIARIDWSSVPTARWTGGKRKAEDAKTSPETMQQLRTLGYLDDDAPR